MSHKIRNSLLYAFIIIVSFVVSGCCPPLPPSFCQEPQPSPVWNRTLNMPGIYGSVTDVVQGGPGFIAVGSDNSRGARAAAIWTSTNGMTWVRIPLDTAIFPDNSVITAVVRGGPGFIAVGMKPTMMGSGTVWTSSDGTTWAIAAEGFGGNLNARINDVVATSSQVIAVGSITVDGLGEQAVVWRSTDSAVQTWTEVYRQPYDPIGNPSWDRSSRILAVSATNSTIAADGGPSFIAVGAYQAIATYGGVQVHDDDSAIWTSTDGLAWVLSSSYDPVFALKHEGVYNEDMQELKAVMIQGSGIYVGGVDGGLTTFAPSARPKASMIWRSGDKGRSWARLSDEQPEIREYFSDEHSVNALAAGGLPFGYGEVAVGRAWDHFGWSEADGAFWRGATGYPRWQGGRSDLFGGSGRQSLTSIAANQNALVVVGIDNGSPAIWTLARPPQ